MAWEKLASNKLTTAGDTLIDTTITAKKHLWIQESKIPTGNCRSKYQFNSDTGNNYAQRYSDNGGTDGTFTSSPVIYAYHSGGSAKALSTTYIINETSKEKLLICEIVENGGDGAGNAPNRQEIVGKWENTSNQITSIKIFNDGTGSFDTDSEVTVYGTD